MRYSVVRSGLTAPTDASSPRACRRPSAAAEYSLTSCPVIARALHTAYVGLTSDASASMRLANSAVRTPGESCVRTTRRVVENLASGRSGRARGSPTGVARQAAATEAAAPERSAGVDPSMPCCRGERPRDPHRHPALSPDAAARAVGRSRQGTSIATCLRRPCSAEPPRVARYFVGDSGARRRPVAVD